MTLDMKTSDDYLTFQEDPTPFFIYKPLYTFLDSFESSYLAPPRTATSALAEIFGFNKHDSASRLHLYNQIVCPIKDIHVDKFYHLGLYP